MTKPRNATLGELIYNRIDSNQYLQEIYDIILFNYSMHLFHQEHRNKPLNKDHALRFADILSKSAGHINSEKHRALAQEIITLLNFLYPKDAKIKAYATSILSSIGNYRGLELINSKYKNSSLLDELYMNFDLEYLSIPHQEDKYFFHKQKEIYEHLEDKTFSYSGPTSMGKSILMRMFIKDKILNGFKGNFVILVPTKALITEISSTIMQEDLKDELSNKNYKVVTSGNSLFLKQDGFNYIMVLTPERLLYTLIAFPTIKIDYCFIDEAHKIIDQDGRSAFYYKNTDMLVQRNKNTHIILASPNIPNPHEFFKALPFEHQEETNFITTSFSPVCQFKYIIDMVKNELLVFNNKFSNKNPFKRIDSLGEIVDSFDAIKKVISLDSSKSNIVYCNGKNKTIEMAIEFAKELPILNNEKLENLSAEIKEEIHDSYFLIDLIKKGVAYHVGYLPLHIRSAIETFFKEGLIKTLFCTSTLIEGVNLPADNLFILSYARGNKTMSLIEFKNLLGRVGRIKYNLYGNVFIIRQKNQSINTLEKLLQDKVCENSIKISLKSSLDSTQKDYIISCLMHGRTEFNKLQDQSDESYDLMRKCGLILLKDILTNRKSVIFEEFKHNLNNEKIELIKSHFNNKSGRLSNPDDDINISLDQTEELIKAIQQGLKYPELKNEKVDYYDLVEFLDKLYHIFKWNIYEKDTIGNLSRIRYYAIVLVQWMNGHGLNYILDNAIKYNKNYNRQILINKNLISYDNSPEHKNYIIGDTLNIIENTILFSIANYFLKFSTEYKRLIGGDNIFRNDWYEYVEFGSTNELTIFLQRNGLTRDTSEYIKKHKERYVTKQNNTYKLKQELLSCGKKSVEDELKEVLYNVPELFI